MRRPLGVRVVAVLTFFVAVVLVLGSLAFFFVAVMAMTGGDAGDQVSVALAGMGIAGGFSLLVLAGIATSLTIGVLKLREWARIVSIAFIGAGVACTIFSLFALRGYVVIPAAPSVACHLLVLATAGFIIEYLSRAGVKVVFRGLTLTVAKRYRSATLPPSPGVLSPYRPIALYGSLQIWKNLDSVRILPSHLIRRCDMSAGHGQCLQ
jgi:hypothetical protein